MFEFLGPKKFFSKFIYQKGRGAGPSFLRGKGWQGLKIFISTASTGAEMFPFLGKGKNLVEKTPDTPPFWVSNFGGENPTRRKKGVFF